MTSPDRLREGFAVAITGAAGGIGSALARAFARRGARVALLDLPGPALDALAAELRASGADALALACDVTDAAQTRAATAAAVARFGGLDVAIANAGITHIGRFAETDAAVLRRVMDVNFFGAVHLAQAAAEPLAARRGVLVVVSSVAGFAPLAGRAGYAASKHALHGLFASVRVEWRRRGVQVLIACPSFVATDIGKRALGPDGGAPRDARTTTGKPASPDAVAEAIARAAIARRRFLVLSPVGVASWWLARLWPAGYERIMERRLLRGEAAP
ncbi:MAG: short chain dehydrogenase [Proteobacteria bacterium]|nr:MAG: short chain dehydrogenase [Pseudomonadota bacterium]